MTDELKPCPFCGSTHIEAARGELGGWVRCRGCQARLEEFGSGEAIDAWNRRAPASAPDQQREPVAAKAGLSMASGPRGETLLWNDRSVQIAHVRFEGGFVEALSRLEALSEREPPQAQGPIWGPPRPMAEVPRDGTRVLVSVRLDDQFALGSSVVVRWLPERFGWGMLNKNSTWPEKSFTGWWPLPLVEEPAK